MGKKLLFFLVLAWAFGNLQAARAQSPSLLPMPAPVTTEPAPVPSEPPGSLVPSDWILYRKSETCCGPIGCDGPLKTEFFLRAGWSFPIGTGIYGDTLTTGWAIEGGARLLFFNPTRDGAWSLGLSGSNIWNQGKNPNVRIPLSILLPNAQGVVERVELGKGNLPGVTVRDLNRTFVNVIVGKDWFLSGPVNNCTWNWRVGLDAGGRYGSASAQFHEIRARTDVIGGIFVGGHTDLDIPCGCCVFNAGLRTEWSYTWSDILQQSSDVEEINLLFTVGVRY
jgi:hypothetical protein